MVSLLPAKLMVGVDVTGGELGERYGNYNTGPQAWQIVPRRTL